MNVQTTIEQSVPERLARVRAVMAGRVDALLVPSADPHLPSICRATGKGVGGCRALRVR